MQLQEWGESLSHESSQESSVESTICVLVVPEDVARSLRTYSITVDVNTPINGPSYPNNITGPAGFGEQNFVPVNQVLPYTIQFENEPTAGFPAQQVVITQQLDPNLNAALFRLGSFGFGGQIYQVPANTAFYQTQIDLTQTNGFYVDVTATIDDRTGIATWIFTTINPSTGQVPVDPTVGFLPPDNSSGIGEGSSLTPSWPTRPIRQAPSSTPRPQLPLMRSRRSTRR